MNALKEFVIELINTLGESIITLLPILIFFILFQVLYLKLPRQYIFNVLKGVLISFVGLTLFLFGVDYGFLPAGNEMGEIMGQLNARWILIPLGFMFGFMVTLAEPAVRVLGYEIDKTSSGSIPDKLVIVFMALAVGLAIALGMGRIIFGFPIQYLLVPGYIIVLGMLKFSPGNFISIAFDAGGVATGPMVTTFVVAIALGAARVIPGRDAVLDGFGIIALVAMVPILVIMVLGMFFGEEKEGV